MTQVVTRIAPSPTGSMHIGTARAALFNYLYAKRHDGQFLLRIEDTDKERSTPEAVDVIFDSLKWLDLEFDGTPVFQSARASRHAMVVQELVQKGAAYYDFMTPDETTAWKDANKNKAFRSYFRDMPGPSDGMTRTVISSSPFVVRFKGPTTGETVINDLIKGECRFQNENLDDLVLLRSDGSPTYNLAVVVDDHDMGITHVIRGDDHLNNAARQKLIYEALGWDVPEFAHMPLILNPEGKKLSKRDGDLSVLDMANMGYVPDAMVNYLTRLGWGHGDDEIFSMAQAIEWFDVADVVSAPARLDWNKLNFINNHYLRTMDSATRAGLVFDILAHRPLVFDGNRVRTACDLLVEGASTLEKLADMILFAVAPITYDEKARAVLATETAKDILLDLRAALMIRGIEPSAWNVEELNVLCREFSNQTGIKMKDVGNAMRAALTGVTVAPDLGTCLVAIGREVSFMRLSDAIDGKI